MTLTQSLAPWCLLVIIGSMGLTFVRLLLGPTTADRALAIDLLSILAAVAMAPLAIEARQPSYLSVALAISLVSFVATVALAAYVRRRAEERPDDASG